MQSAATEASRPWLHFRLDASDVRWKRAEGPEFHDPRLFGDLAPVPLSADGSFDWRVPELDRSARLEIHSWTFSDFWIPYWRRTGDAEPLTWLSDLAHDYLTRIWFRRDELPQDRGYEFVAIDMTPADRAAALAYLLGQAGDAVPMSDERRALFVRAYEEHIEWALQDEHYNFSNHGLMNDARIIAATTYFPADPRSEGWKRTATDRFLKVLLGTQLTEGGIHREHTSKYTMLWRAIAGRVVPFLEKEPAETVSAAMRRVEDNFAWFVKPDGWVVNMGDQVITRAPDWVAKDKAGVIAFPDGGYAVSRQGASYAMLIAAYHASKPNKTGWLASGHKQRDELSFVWQEDGVDILTDTGLASYKYGPDRNYATSKLAHNTVLLQPSDYLRGKLYDYMIGTTPYGSGILGAKELPGGVAALEGYDPLTQQRGLSHRRILFVKPRRWLVVADIITTSVGRRAEWSFHLGPEFEAAVEETGFSAKAGAMDLDVRQYAHPEPHKPRFEVHRGSTDPVRGWLFESRQSKKAIDNLSIVDWLSSGRHLRMTLFSIGGRGDAPATVEIADAPFGDPTRGAFSFNVLDPEGATTIDYQLSPIG